MSTRLDDQIRALMQQVVDESPAPPPTPLGPAVHPEPLRLLPNWVVAMAAAVAVLVLVGGAAMLFGGQAEEPTVDPATDNSLAPVTTLASPATTTPEAITSEPPLATGSPGWRRVGADAAASTLELYGVAPLADGLIAVGVAVGEDGRIDGAILTSIDGVEWARVAEDDDALTTGAVLLEGGVIETASGLVAIGGSCPESPCGIRPSVWFSSDGAAWELIPHDPAVFGSQGWIADAVVTDAGVVAVGLRFDDSGSGFAPAVWSSPDGLAWTLDWTGAVQPVFENQGMAIINGNGFSMMEAVTVTTEGNLVAVGSACDVSDAQYECSATVWTSVDGNVWNRAPHDASVFSSDTPGSHTVMTDVATSHETLVAVGTDNGTAAVAWMSHDGVTWIRLELPEAMVQTAELSVITAMADGFLAAGPGWAGSPNHPIATVWASSDGSTWSETSELGIGIVAAIIPGGPGIAVGNDPSDETGAIWIPPKNEDR